MKTALLFLATALTLSPLHAAKKEATPPCDRESGAPGKYSDKSLYQLDTTWASDTGKAVKLDVSRDHPVVLAMFFTNCQHSCPTIVADMKAIEAKLSKSAREKTDFVLISIDPARDTTTVLSDFRKKHDLNKDHWLLLNGNSDAVKKVADFTGFKYSAGSETQYAHSLLVTVLNKKGEVIYQQAGLGVSPVEGAKAVEAEASKK
jgi:protein SCO1/2